jgi:hypothetical protein
MYPFWRVPTPSTAEQAKTIAFKSVRAMPFTRVHGRPTQHDYKILKEEACALASKVKDITHPWSKSATDNYGLLADILGVDEYNNLTNIATYAIPHEPASYDPNITNATRRTHGREWKKSGNLFGPCGSSKRAFSKASLTTFGMPLMSNTIPSSAIDSQRTVISPRSRSLSTSTTAGAPLT